MLQTEILNKKIDRSIKILDSEQKIPYEEKVSVPAVVLSSHTSGLGTIRALGKKGVPIIALYYEKNDMGFVSKYVNEKIIVPHPEKEEVKFISSLIEIGKRIGKSILLPADDETLSSVSRNKRLLEKYFLVAATDWHITQKFIDKKFTYQLAEKLHIPIPKTLVPRSEDELAEYGKKVMYPCIIKPTHSHTYFEEFKRKMQEVYSYKEMLKAYKEAAKHNIEVMVQELIPGEDDNGVNYNSYFANGEVIAEFIAEKVRLSPPKYGVPCVVKSSVDIPEVSGPAKKFIKALGFNGYSCMEFKKDSRDNIYKLMELNGRSNRSASLAIECGINFQWIIYNHVVNNILPETKDYKKDVFWIDEIRDILTTSGRFLTGKYSMKNFLAPYKEHKIYSIYDSDDIKPFIKRCFDLTWITGNRIIRAAKNFLT